MGRLGVTCEANSVTWAISSGVPRAEPGGYRAARLSSEGRAMPMDQAIALALAAPTQAGQDDEDPRLSPREREVAILVAQR